MTDSTSDSFALLDGHSPFISRRWLLGSALGLAAASAPIVSGAQALPAPDASALKNLRMLMKLQTSLAAAAVPWFYSGSIYAVQGDSAPLHLIDFEGTEIYWVHPQPDDVWLVSASTLTFYRDVATGAYLDEFANPLTGKRVEVKPNVLRLPPGASMKYSSAGIEAFGQLVPWKIGMWRSGKLLWMQTSRAAGPAPSLEVSTMFADTVAADNPKTMQVAAHFSSTSFSPWSRWMEMGDRAGHLVWHGAGRKLTNNSEMPADYRSRAERAVPLHFTDPYLQPPAQKN